VHVSGAGDSILRLSASRPRPDVGVVRVAGELDGQSSPGLRASIAAAAADGTEHLVLDVGGLTFVDSSGIEVLLRARQEASATLHLVGVARSRALHRVLDLFGLLDQFEQHPDVDALLASLD
jgi:anti-sigma B factor antagonist